MATACAKTLSPADGPEALMRVPVKPRRSLSACRASLGSSLCSGSRRRRISHVWMLAKKSVRSDVALQNRDRTLRLRGGWRSSHLAGKPLSIAAQGQRKRHVFQRDSIARPRASATGTDPDVDIAGEQIAEDYYGLLGLTSDATQEDIKKAYYQVMKVCHPDLSGDHPEVVAFCKFINEVYEVLSDPEQRAIYDKINGFTLAAVNPFYCKDQSRDFTFVDEFSCIGCKNCTFCAPSTFDIELDFGRARVMRQQGDALGKVQEAIDTCPVDCIHWVSAAQLTLLEDEMRRMERVNVGLMLAGQGRSGADVFQSAATKWDKRQARALERAAREAAKAKAKSKGEKKRSWWEFTTTVEEEDGGRAAYESKEKRKTAMERAVAAAEAARRWREYSRAGLDRRTRRALPSMTQADEGDAER
ncbi:hypothetical protein CBR_g12210 [Chara braunii]|uniref:J domain-containing protein n=1 Tax=Chara braunii TaxID=69332 RepID=A0A388KRH1_CHABU|nr:hypothetical protein CBR_g12210 [Chara braunii]|eukprot:GBG72636.1 hypothetical protein CBR_g12210 [Chara braunii]